MRCNARAKYRILGTCLRRMHIAAHIMVIRCLTTNMYSPHLQPLEQLIFVSGYPQWAHGVKGDGPFGRLLCCSSFVIPANWHQVHIWNWVSIGEETEYAVLLERVLRCQRLDWQNMTVLTNRWQSLSMILVFYDFQQERVSLNEITRHSWGWLSTCEGPCSRRWLM